MNSPIVRNWLPGMIASTRNYTLRSNLPTLTALNAYVGTPGLIYYDHETNLTYCTTLNKAFETLLYINEDHEDAAGERTQLLYKDMYIGGIIVRTETLTYNQNEKFPEVIENLNSKFSSFISGTPHPDNIKIPDGKEVTLMTKGDIAVRTEKPTKPGDNVYFRVAERKEPRNAKGNPVVRLPEEERTEIYSFTHQSDDVKLKNSGKFDVLANGTVRIPHAYFIEHIDPFTAVMNFVAPNIITTKE